MKHKDSGWRCLLAHYNPDGTMGPQCVICEGCGEHIRPEKMAEECPGGGPTRLPSLKDLQGLKP